MRLLILSFSYAPRANPRAIRWTELATRLARRGWSVTVVTSWEPGLPDVEVMQGVHVHRAGLRVIEALRRLLARHRTAREAAAPGGAAPAAKRTGLAGRLAEAVNRRIWSRLWWPDSSCVWIWPALRTARRILRAGPADAIVSVSPTFSAVVAGYLLAGSAPGSRWILDLGDPFSILDSAPANNFRLYGALNRRFERSAFERATAVSVTTEGTRALYSELVPSCRGRIHVIPPILPEAALARPAGTPPFFGPGPAVRLLYVGTLYRGLRRPDCLLALFGALVDAVPGQPWELHFIGDVHQCADSLAAAAARLPGRIIVHGPAPRADAVRATHDADILVNLGNDTPFQLPSKLVEYAATGKRIVSISRATDDSSAAFLSAYPAALCMHDGGGPPGPDAIEAFIRFCSDARQAPRAEERDAFVAPFRAAAITHRYEALLGGGPVPEEAR